MHLGLCFSINNAYEHLSLLKFDFGSSIGTSSFDVSSFLNWALQIKLAACKCKGVLKSELAFMEAWLQLGRRRYSLSVREQKLKLHWTPKEFFFFLFINKSSWRWRMVLWPLFPFVIEHHCFILSLSCLKFILELTQTLLFLHCVFTYIQRKCFKRWNYIQVIVSCYAEECLKLFFEVMMKSLGDLADCESYPVMSTKTI